MSSTRNSSPQSLSSPESSSSSFTTSSSFSTPETSSLPEALPYRPASLTADSTRAFLFIDSGVDNPQNPVVSKKKHAFLQRNYQRKKKQAAIDRLKSSKPFPEQGLPIQYREVGEQSNQDPPSLTIGRNQESRQAESPCETSKELTTRKMSEMWSLRGYLSQGFVDPFYSSAVQMTNSMNLYFHHFRIHTVEACYPVDAKRMGTWLWEIAINQPALLQALLFLTAGHHANLESMNGVSSQAIQKSKSDSLRLRGDSMKTLNDTLQNPLVAVTESTTVVVSALMAIEAVNANIEALKAHTKGLKRLVHLLGGLDVFDHMTISKIYQCDVKSAAVNNSRPIFPLSSKWQSEILQAKKIFQSSGEIRIPEDLSTLGQNFFTASWYRELDSSIKTLLQVLRRLIVYYEVAQRQPLDVVPTDNDLFLMFEYQLLSAKYTTTTDDIHESLRLTLLIYLNSRIWHLQTFPFMRYLTHHLKQSLARQYHHLQKVAPNLLFWILFIGGMASQGYGCHPWFVTNLTSMANYLKLNDWIQVYPILVGFYYTNQPGEKGAENLWNEVLLKEAYPYIAPKQPYFGNMIIQNASYPQFHISSRER